jgi:nitrite reductase (NADH) small subunit
MNPPHTQTPTPTVAHNIPSASSEGWTQVARINDVPLLEGRRAFVDGRPIAVYRLSSGWAATDAECPHRGGPLADGLLTDQCVTCPLHGRKFDLQTGTQDGGDDTVTVHEIQQRADELWVRIASSQ